MADRIDGEIWNYQWTNLTDCLTIIAHLPHALVPLALLYYCPIAKPPLPQFWRFTHGRIIWSSGLPQWRTMGSSGVQLRAWGHWEAWELVSSTMRHAHTQLSTLCKAACPSWKRTYFAPRCQFAQNGQIFPGKKESGVERGTWETGNWGQSDKPWHKAQPGNIFRTMSFLFAVAI